MKRRFVIEVEVDSEMDNFNLSKYNGIEKSLKYAILDMAEKEWKDKWGHDCSSDIIVHNVKRVKSFSE